MRHRSEHFSGCCIHNPTVGLVLAFCTMAAMAHISSGLSLHFDSECEEADKTCRQDDLFQQKDSRCWVTCTRTAGGVEAVGHGSVCRVNSGPQQGVHKCNAGRWVTMSGPSAKETKLRVKRFRIRIRFWRRRYSPPPNQAPYFTSCPTGGVSAVAPANQRTAQVSWSVSAADPNGGAPSVTLTQGSPPNSVFNEGHTAISYTATDSGGMTDSCSFTVAVTVIRCSVPSPLTHGVQACQGLETNIHGASCHHTCDAGHVMHGAQQVTCQSSGGWSSAFPTCPPVVCGDPGAVSGGSVQCPPGHDYPDTCVLQCHPGFQLTGPASVHCQQDGQWSGQFSSCLDVEAPTFPNGCPADLSAFSGPLESPVSITWTDPVTTDNSGQSVTLTSDLAKGSQLGLGSHTVTLNASDAVGNVGSCNFYVTVQARTCNVLTAPSNGQLSCTRRNVEGSECTTACNLGFRLQGAVSVLCLNTQQWDNTQPSCQAILCPTPTVPHGSFQCPLGYQHPASCSLTCQPGFDVIAPRHIRCQSNATWSASGFCHDIQPPVFTNGCPANLHVSAAPLGTSTTVQWVPPDVTDNSGLHVQLVSGVTPGPAFVPGVSVVTYTATDVTGNNASCQFSVNVTVLQCPDPSTDTREGHQAMLHTCHSGHVYGARCAVSCSQGHTLLGQQSVLCDKDNSTHPPTMAWRWSGGPSAAPICRANQCPDLNAPKDGALACHLGPRGKDCAMLCEASWDVPYVTSGHFYCVNSTWLPRTTVPDCVVRMLPGRVRMQTTLFYFAGSCNTTHDLIRQTFVARMKSSPIYKDACDGLPSCSADNIEVTCGVTAAVRGRRDTSSVTRRVMRAAVDRARRSGSSPSVSHVYLVTFHLHLPYHEQDSSPQHTYQRYMDRQRQWHQSLLKAAQGRLLDVDHLQADQSAVVPTSLHLDCPPGTLPRNPHSSSPPRFSCVGCSKGYYLSEDSGQCQECPVGSYSQLSSATSCAPCPAGSSTASTGSQHSSQCQPVPASSQT